MTRTRILTSLSLAALIVAAGLHSAASAQEQPAEAPPDRPNIIFIMADDLGYGDLGCYGQTKITTPVIDRLAAEGMRFTDYYAGSTVCAPSRCVLMTGLHTGHCFIRGNSKQNLRIGDITVGEVLKKAGYKTAAFGKWGLGHENTGGMPTMQGFDTFYGYLDQHHAHNYYPAFLIKDTKREPLTNVVPGDGEYGGGVATEKNEYSHDLIFAQAMIWLEQVQDQPFFLYLPFTIPHANNEAKDKGMEIGDYGQYASEDWADPEKGFAAMVTRLDSDIGLFMERLQEYGIDDRTIVFFTSDNGPHKEGGRDQEFFDSNGPLRGHKRDLYDGGIRVPFIARWPGKIAPGSTSAHVASHQDLMATVAELAGGARYPKDTDSLSLVPTLIGDDAAQQQHPYLYWEFHEKGLAQAVRQGKWKAMRKGIEEDAAVELYDLAADIAEATDVAAANPDVVADLREAMNSAHVESEQWPTKPVPESPRLFPRRTAVPLPEKSGQNN